MLQSRAAFRHNNQENSAQPAALQHPTKTPLRQQSQPLKPGLTGGKARAGGGGEGLLQTAKGGRVLGHKDGNQGKSGADANIPVKVTKPSASTSGPIPVSPIAGPAPSSALLSPTPQPILPSHLRTPSPGLHRFASLSLLSPDVENEVEMEEEAPEEEELDREVEYAGLSSVDYDEPYEPDFPMPDFKSADYGTLLRGLPMSNLDGHEAWEAQDAIDRESFKFTLDSELPSPDSKRARVEEASEPLFPSAQRLALAPKSINSTRPVATSRPLLSSSRKPVNTNTPGSKAVSARAPLSSSISRRPLDSANRLLVSAQTPKPKWGTTSTSAIATPSRSSSSASIARPPPSSVSRPTPPPSAVSRTPLTTTRKPLIASNRLVPATQRKPSSSLTTLTEGSPVGPITPSSRIVASEEEERELGIWGVTA
ncbi:hypothetical protein P7C70_g2243, partial [Phenoliferia sp. Uapishka_3]